MRNIEYTQQRSVSHMGFQELLKTYGKILPGLLTFQRLEALDCESRDGNRG